MTNRELWSPHAQRVAKFMDLAGQDVPTQLGDPGEAVRVLRVRLILEELLETLVAWGVSVCVWTRVSAKEYTLPRNEPPFRDLDTALCWNSLSAWEDDGETEQLVDFVESVDGLLDLRVVTMGTILALGGGDTQPYPVFQLAQTGLGPAVPMVPAAQLRQHFAEILLRQFMRICDAIGVKVKLAVQLEPEMRADGAGLRELRWEDVLGYICRPLYDGDLDVLEAVSHCHSLLAWAEVTLAACGLQTEPMQQLIDENNLAKFGPGGYKDEATGKWIKPPGHKKPDILAELVKQGYPDPLENLPPQHG